MFNMNHTPWRWSALRTLPIALWALLISVLASSVSIAQSGLVRLEHDDDRYTSTAFSRGGFIEHDPTLDVEVWTDNESGRYYEGDKINIYFRTNGDAYVAIYNIDTDGRVNLIYPFGEYDNPYIEGGRIYRIPGPDADYDLLVDGPAGTENIQIIASRRPFPVPDWYNGSGLVADRDRYEFMDYLNNNYFGCRSGCPRAIDNVSYVVKEWDNYYYRPVYYDPWPVWGSYGGLYVDYYWGSSIYVDGYYYGIAPLYLPRLGFGYHVISVYDSYGYGWENTVNIHNSTAIHLDNTIIRTTAGTRSRFRSVRNTGYRNPARNGYAGVKITSKYRPRATTKLARKSTTSRTVTTRTVKTRNGTTTRSKIDKSTRVRGFNYKKNDRATTKSGTAKRTKRTKRTRSTTESSKSGQRLTAYKNAPDGGNKARVRRSGRSGSSRATSVERSGLRGNSAGKSGGKSRGARSSKRNSSYERHGSRSSSRGKSGVTRSRTSRKSSGNRSVRKSRSGGSRSSAGAGRSGRSGRSGASARGSRSSGRSGGSARGARSGGSARSGGAARGGRSGRSGGSKGKPRR